MEINAQLVRELREKTGAGMMNCKKALLENEGDFEKSIEYLRQKGLASADKKSSRQTSEGIIQSYIHTGSKLGVLVEINCETDFVARREEFQNLARDIAMQVAACPAVEYVAYNDIPETLITKEKEFELKKEDLANKPENIKEKIVEGRIEKNLKTLCLLEQPFIKDQSITIDEVVKQSISLLGENIQIRRFIKYQLGQ